MRNNLHFSTVPKVGQRVVGKPFLVFLSQKKLIPAVKGPFEKKGKHSRVHCVAISEAICFHKVFLFVFFSETRRNLYFSTVPSDTLTRVFGQLSDLLSVQPLLVFPSGNAGYYSFLRKLQKGKLFEKR